MPKREEYVYPRETFKKHGTGKGGCCHGKKYIKSTWRHEMEHYENIFIMNRINQKWLFVDVLRIFFRNGILLKHNLLST
jgi:hypothetical protein